VFYEEPFDTGTGAFSATNVCGSFPVWTNSGGFAHASEPGSPGVSFITSPVVTIPAKTSNVRLRLSHKTNTEDGYDGGQVLVAMDGGTMTLVTTFTVGPYTNGVHADQATCAVSGTTKNKYPGWSGNHAQFESEVDLSAAPFNAVAGSTIAITFRMSSDDSQNGNGWDIDWVRLTGDVAP
jgi:hypothetical protein